METPSRDAPPDLSFRDLLTQLTYIQLPHEIFQSILKIENICILYNAYTYIANNQLHTQLVKYVTKTTNIRHNIFCIIFIFKAWDLLSHSSGLDLGSKERGLTQLRICIYIHIWDCQYDVSVNTVAYKHHAASLLVYRFIVQTL